MKSFSIEFSTLDTIVIMLSIATGNFGILAFYLLTCYLVNERSKPVLRNRTLRRCQTEAENTMMRMLASDGESASWRGLRDWRIYSRLKHYISQLK